MSCSSRNPRYLLHNELQSQNDNVEGTTHKDFDKKTADEVHDGTSLNRQGKSEEVKQRGGVALQVRSQSPPRCLNSRNSRLPSSSEQEEGESASLSSSQILPSTGIFSRQVSSGGQASADSSPNSSNVSSREEGEVKPLHCELDENCNRDPQDVQPSSRHRKKHAELIRMQELTEELKHQCQTAQIELHQLRQQESFTKVLDDYDSEAAAVATVFTTGCLYSQSIQTPAFHASLCLPHEDIEEEVQTNHYEQQQQLQIVELGKLQREREIIMHLIREKQVKLGLISEGDEQEGGGKICQTIQIEELGEDQTKQLPTGGKKKLLLLKKKKEKSAKKGESSDPHHDQGNSPEKKAATPLPQVPKSVITVNKQTKMKHKNDEELPQLQQQVTLIKSSNPAECDDTLEAYRRRNSLPSEEKQEKRFIACILDMVESCSPPSGEAEVEKKKSPMSLKLAWKWLKFIIEDYVAMKKARAAATTNSSQMYKSCYLQQKPKGEEESVVSSSDRSRHSMSAAAAAATYDAAIISAIAEQVQARSKEDTLQKVQELVAENKRLSKMLAETNARGAVNVTQYGQLQQPPTTVDPKRNEVRLPSKRCQVPVASPSLLQLVFEGSAQAEERRLKLDCGYHDEGYDDSSAVDFAGKINTLATGSRVLGQPAYFAFSNAPADSSSAINDRQKQKMQQNVMSQQSSKQQQSQFQGV